MTPTLAEKCPFEVNTPARPAAGSELGSGSTSSESKQTGSVLIAVKEEMEVGDQQAPIVHIGVCTFVLACILQKYIIRITIYVCLCRDQTQVF